MGVDILDYLILNNRMPNSSILKKYEKEKSKFVDVDLKNLKKLNIKIIASDFIDNNLLVTKNLIRHDSKKLARVIMNLMWIIWKR